MALTKVSSLLICRESRVVGCVVDFSGVVGGLLDEVEGDAVKEGFDESKETKSEDGLKVSALHKGEVVEDFLPAFSGDWLTEMLLTRLHAGMDNFFKFFISPIIEHNRFN